MGDQSVLDPACPPPVACSHSGQQFGTTTKSNTFPTEAVLGGTLGGLSVIALALIIYASFKHWNRTRRRHHSHYRRSQAAHRKKNTLTLFGDPPLFTYDITGLPKPLHSYAHMQPDVYIARPYMSPRRQMNQRHALAAMLDPRDDSSEREFCPRGGGGAGGADDSHYEPSIIAGSFVYHPPSNLPPHLTRTPHTHLPAPSPHEMHPDLSYDSFKNDHLYDSNTRGMTSSTLNNHHHPPDFYL
ncbi:uncharacterized protein [Littorina saxatilis]|uniref:Uncharacterized protein n=1 Tax=Littorina saxatilis TaxID=31220 RepID=A0AAN9GB80_9CAEN